MKFRRITQSFIVIVVFQSYVYAQGITEPLTGGTFEVGYSHYWHRGEFYRSSPAVSSSDVRSNGTIYIRMGIFDYITLSAEGMVWPVSSSNNAPGESFLNYTFGLGLSSPKIKLSFFDFFIHFHYLDNLYLDRSSLKHDKRFRDLKIGIPLRYHFQKEYAIWLAPVYIWNVSAYIEEQTYTRSINSAGISVGLDAFFYEHIYINLSLSYTEHILPGINAGFRF